MDYINERVSAIADYVIEYKCTVRAAAKVFGISKSAAHTDLNKRLKHIDADKHFEVMKIMKANLAVRHIRGGESTKLMYANKAGKLTF